MKWPTKFCEYYADKFFNHYEASGWKLSNGNTMKNWQAAFNSQWQHLRFQFDIDFFNKCKTVVVKETQNHLDELLHKYKFHSVELAELRPYYEEMKALNVLVTIPREQALYIFDFYKGDLDICKAIRVEKTLSYMKDRQITFTQLLSQ